MNRRASFLLVVATVGVVACNTAAPGASPSPSASQSPSASPGTPTAAAPTAGPPSAEPTSPANSAPAGIAGRKFVSIAVRDGDADYPLVPGTRIAIEFGDDLRADAGCNHLFGNYRLDGDTLVVEGMGQTEMGCQPPLMAQDEWLIDFLGSRPTVALNGDELVLTSGDTTLSMLNREVAEPDQPLTEITWTLTSIVAGDAVSSVPDGITATFLFRDDGTLELNSGCNSGGGPFTIDGDKIQFGDIIMTLIGCTGAAAAVEEAVVTLLNSDSATYSIEGSTLTLDAGANGLVFSAATDQPLPANNVTGKNS